ncbi:MAG: hypothetical protein KDE27_01205 [Planctomycetes bacterium]|nr:hypothetical protein [Planctomycetota bacterium]
MERTRSRQLAGVVAVASFACATVAAQGRSWKHVPGWRGYPMVYDAARGTIVQYDGIATRTRFGADATARAPVTRPPDRFDHGLAYDERRQRTVLFGGTLPSGGLIADTWEFDGASWQRRTPALQPPARSRYLLGYDPSRGVTVLCGGNDAQGRPRRDTWEWNGANWRLAAVPGPEFESYTGRMAFDPANAAMLLHLGNTYSTPAATWLWNGIGWRRTAPATLPPVWSGFDLATDRARRRVVLFGGRSSLNGAPSDATWLWNGVTWQRQQVATVPPARENHGMTFDSDRGRVLMSGGWTGALYCDDAFEWDGVDWHEVERLNRPRAVSGAALAFDDARAEAVLFGGGNSVYGGQYVPLRYVDQTWLWNGARWRLAAPASVPPARTNAMMASDPARGRIVLFGGQVDQGVLDDTWEWDGTNWARVATAVAPPGRELGAMAFDPVNGGVLLFGGVNPWRGSMRFGDTWSFDGVRWLRRAPATRPPALLRHAMATDLARGTVVMVGWSESWLPFTWEWNGVDWRARVARGPSPRVSMGLAYDSKRRTIVLQGGIAAFDTWEWDGLRWRPVAGAGFAAGDANVMVYDAARDRLLSYGMGRTAILGDVVSPSARSRGSGCGGSTIPQLAGEQVWLCGHCRVELLDAAATAPAIVRVGLAPTNLPLGGGCTLLVADGAERLVVTDVRGRAAVSTPIGSDPSLRGIDLHAQAAVLDPTAPQFGVALTAGLRLVIGG